MDPKTALLALALVTMAGGRMQNPYYHELEEDQMAMESGYRGSTVRRLLPDRTPSARVPIRRPQPADSVTIEAAGYLGDNRFQSSSVSAEGGSYSQTSPLPWWQMSRSPVLVLQPILMPMAKGRSAHPEYYGAAASPEALGHLGVQALRRRLPFDINHLNRILRNVYYY